MGPIDKPDLDEAGREALAKMAEWIAHPMEFGKKPERIEIADRRELYTPEGKVEECFLVRYRVNGEEFIGFTGFITWSFFAIDLNAHSFEELYLKYIGWYICFSVQQSRSYDKAKEKTGQEEFIATLAKDGYTDIQIKSAVAMSEGNIFEASGQMDGSKYHVVGRVGGYVPFDHDFELPLYFAVGQMWEPFNLNG